MDAALATRAEGGRGRRIRRGRIGYAAFVGLGTLVIAEIGLRLFVSGDPAYYVAFSDPEPGTVVEYPYGVIRYNRDGFADDDFDAEKRRPRVGYLGDSVCFGVGAGHGYRVSELMEAAYPGYEHMNFTGGLGGGTMQVREKAIAFSERYDLDAVVYMMNLNDVLPDGRREGLKNLQQNPLFQAVEWLRGRVYLYTYARQILKDLRGGTAPPSYELFPAEYAGIVSQTAGRVSEIGREMERRGVRFVVLIVPYEMQVSDDAAGVYTEAGHTWEDGFVDGSTQDALIRLITDAVVVDGLDGFVAGPADRARYAVGETFVYNLGERMDWNHPNRLGHRLLAEHLASSGALDGLTLGEDQ
jgi:hypothetical protein